MLSRMKTQLASPRASPTDRKAVRAADKLLQALRQLLAAADRVRKAQQEFDRATGEQSREQ